MYSMSKCNSNGTLSTSLVLGYCYILKFVHNIRRACTPIMINVQTVNSNDYHSFSCISQPWCLSQASTDSILTATSQEPDIFIDIFGATTSRLNPATQRQWKPTRPCFYNCMLDSLWHTHWQRQITLWKRPLAYEWWSKRLF